MLLWLVIGVAFIAAFLYYRWKPSTFEPKSNAVVGFFHPYSNDGGGGERVLWCSVRAIQNAYKDARCVIYTGKGASSGEILRRAKERFNIELERPVQFIFLEKRHWIEAKRYPRMTLLGQSIGSMFLGWEALNALIPDVFIDTMGYAFTYPLVKFRSRGRCAVAAYVHYPTISTDMLKIVSNRMPTYNNSIGISGSWFRSKLKHFYYMLFALSYGYVGGFADAVMVNSSWTQGHIEYIWVLRAPPHRVYPPCDTKGLEQLPLERSGHMIVSVAQFRPEKDHDLQLRAFAFLMHHFKGDKVPKDLRLVLIGSCRNREDEERIGRLKKKCEELRIQDRVEFQVNISYEQLRNFLGRAVIGIHTMWNEHFGIGVVEYMAAGAIAVAHDSGGPREDIIVPHNGEPTGFLATTSSEYAAKMQEIFDMDPKERRAMQESARQAIQQFSEAQFESGFLNALQGSVFPEESNS